MSCCLIDMMNTNKLAATTFAYVMFDTLIEGELEECSEELEHLESHQLDERYHSMLGYDFVNDFYSQMTCNMFSGDELPETMNLARFQQNFKLDELAVFVDAFEESSEDEREEFLIALRDDVIEMYLSNEQSMKLYNDVMNMVDHSM